MKWNGFKFPMGLFIVWDEDHKQIRIGKCDPFTKEIIEWFHI
jgi:hypothetical protein